ncbi:Por secretion system C-terminal sorting domain-containing protein [Flavobacterium degerlachei]|uniref:Por secretion system C-terminal sorting domain-containing protein n=2 Tax=Flavobacterium degerlachei TaxID=229203 RepID=A0A1H2PY22_9FLAO|nr:Por secretion system C-terminal sorting domain-containing protein [Flavobacterium degerlachei]
MSPGTEPSNYTYSSIPISSGAGGVNVTSVNISFPAIIYYAIDDIKVGPAISTCTVPTITSNPTNRSVCSGNNTTFSIAATGATSYQWQVNTGSGFANISNGGVYSNATTSSLAITGATAGMNGYLYRCVASSGTSTCFTNSNSGTLNVTSITATAIAQTNVSCNGGSNGSATVAASGGTAGYTYSWSPSGGTAATATGLTSGAYTVTITDANGCTATKSFVITQPTALVATAIAQTNVSCNGGSNGSASVGASGGTAGYTYAWSPSGGTSATATGLSAGNYTATITDAIGCTATKSFTITQPGAIALTPASQTNIACNGGATGGAAVNTATGGAGGYTYNWTPGNPAGDGTTSVTGLTAGTWTCTVTDANSCTTSQSFTITQPSAIALTPASQTNIACNGGATGAATVNTATGGSGGYTYNWTPGNPIGDGTTAVTGLTAGTWMCTVTDANGCTTSQSFTITQSTALVATTSQTNVSCNGGSNGSASVGASGGTAGYTYAWSPSGGTSATATGLSAGNYTATITDANGCTATKSFTLTQPAVLSASIASQTNIACSGGATGSSTVTVTGGTAPYTYLWSNAATTATITGVIAGTYNVTATDANGCTSATSVTITQPTVLSASIASQTNIACNGGATGSSTVTVTGGTTPYTYLWSNGATTATITGVTAGTYNVTATDANGCTSVTSVTITEPTVLVATTIAQTNVSCNGGSNGSATVIANGGTAGYTYAWSPSGGTAATATGLAAGVYAVTITDANGCTAVANATITQPSSMQIAMGTPVVYEETFVNGQSYCGGTSNFDNWILFRSKLNLSSNYSSLTFSSSAMPDGITLNDPIAINQIAAALQNGTSVIVTSEGHTWNVGIGCTSGSCSDASVVELSVDNGGSCSCGPGGSLRPQIGNQNWGGLGGVTCSAPTQTMKLKFGGEITNVSCKNGNDGAVKANVSGGTAPYTYQWAGSPTGDGTDSVTGLTAGTYGLTVTDANGCVSTSSVTITEPALLVATAVVNVNVTCNGLFDGEATAAATGGTAPYTYLWSNAATTARISGVASGTYNVTATDANGCTSASSVTITEPTALSASIASQTNVSCNGGANGSSTVTVTGGTAPYTYLWSNGATTASITGVIAGTYNVTVTDANGCTSATSVKITQPTVLSASIASQTNISCNGVATGSSTVTVTGGTAPYTYLWSNGATTASITGVIAGTYNVTATDANGCTSVTSVTITEPTALSASIASQTNISCNGDATGSSIVSVTGGTAPYTYLWSNGATTASITGVIAGTYNVTATDANGCTSATSVTITEPTALSFTVTTLSGYDYNTAYSQTIEVSGGTGIKSYAVTAGNLPSGFTLSSTGVISGVSTQVADSNFTVTVTDLNGCTATYTYVLKINQILITVTATASQTKVYGQNDSVLTYTVTPNLLSGDSFTGALTRVAGESVGVYAINVGTLSAGSKYLMTYVSNDFRITTKPIMVTPNAAQTKVYGAADPILAYSTTPSLVSGDSFIGALTRVAGENVGTYSIGQGNLSAGSNYTISYVSKDFGITAKPITVTASAAQEKVYGTVDPVFAYSASTSLVNGDSFTGTLTRVAGENVGVYAIGQGNLSAGSNYTINYVSKDFGITAKPITVTANASQEKVYGTVDPIFAYSASTSLVSGDSFTGALTRVVGENVGSYGIGQGNLSAGSNYTISYVSNDFRITAKPITVTATALQTKVYGMADPVFGYSVSPSLVGSNVFTGALTRVAGENVGSYGIGQGSLSAGSNYTISYLGTNFSITKADQVITWNQTLGFGCDGQTNVVLTATSNSGLAVSYASSNSNIAKISNGSLVFSDYGSTTITASQAGNINYNQAVAVLLPVVNSQPNLIKQQFENVIFFDNSSRSFSSYSWYKNGAQVPSQTAQYFKENGALNGTYYAVATKLDGTVITTCSLDLSPTLEEEYIKIVPNPVKANASYELVTNVESSRLKNAHVEVFSVGGLLLANKIISENTVNLVAPTVEGIYIVKMTLANGKYFTKNLLVKN